MDKKEKRSQYKNRQINMTEDNKLEEKRIRNLKDRENMLVIVKQKKKRNIDLIKVFHTLL